MATERFDAIVIGTGQGGKPLALSFAEAGRRTAVVERAFVGGTCINVGCTPTKTMIASARVAYLARRGADYGVSLSGPEVDLAKVIARKRAIVTSFRDGSRASLESTKDLSLLFGEASFTGPRSVRVRLKTGGARDLEADTIVINTGGRPADPRLEGSNTIRVLDSTSIMELTALPRHLVVLGGGYIGLEFAQMFRRFGSLVTVIQRGPQLLSREDDDVAEEIATILREDGIDLRLDTTAVRIAPSDGDGFSLTLKASKGARTIEASHLLAAAGRTPNTEGLNVPAAGIEVDEKGFIRVDPSLRTSAAGVYAIGDVKGGPAFTHISYDDYRILEKNLLHGGNATTRGRLVPYTVFTDPQLGRIGLTEKEAREQGRAIRVAKLHMDSVARAIEMDEMRGFMKAIVDAKTDEILGCAALCIEGGEIASMLQIAMMGKLPYTALRDGIFSHPTLAEALNTLFHAFEDA